MRIAEDIAGEFNEFSVNYTNDMIACVPHYLELLAAFGKDLPSDFNPENILDLGCGNGNVTAELLGLFPDSHYTLLDASRRMIDICKAQFGTFHMEYVESYFSEYAFKADHFDLITAGFSLHHCNSEEKKQLFNNIHSSLKKGGIFGYSDLMIDRTKPAHVELLKEWKVFVTRSFPDGEKWEWLMEHYSEFDKPDDQEAQIKWLQNAGFTHVKVITQKAHWTHIRAIKG